MSKKKILIIEDEDAIRKIMSDIFEAQGYDVITAENGKNGIKLAEEEQADLIIIDIMLPDIDGHVVCSQIKSNKNIKSTIIISTSKIDAVDAGKARDSGADDFIVKTTDCAELVEGVKKLISKK